MNWRITDSINNDLDFESDDEDALWADMGTWGDARLKQEAEISDRLLQADLDEPVVVYAVAVEQVEE